MPCCDGETDLVVKLCRGWYVAFLLDIESHAYWTGRNVATIRPQLPGDNWGCVLWPCVTYQFALYLPVQQVARTLPLRCWCVETKFDADSIYSVPFTNRLDIVLIDVFG